MVKVKKQPAFLNGHAMKITLGMDISSILKLGTKLVSSYREIQQFITYHRCLKALGENCKTSDGLLQYEEGDTLFSVAERQGASQESQLPNEVNLC